MSGKGVRTDEGMSHPREADMMLHQGTNAADVIRNIGVYKITCYRLRREFGGMKDLEHEDMRLTKLVAELKLGNSILQQAA